MENDNNMERARESISTVCDHVEPYEQTSQVNELESKEVAHQDPKDIESNGPSPSIPPLDGGRGWWVILGAFFIQVLCFGVASSWCDARYL
ncbi:hypothetical protein BC941DRAFT_153958 [Chlamydoabsidia padenii]|nr:hypothetical protein BC941DRAFT_153958 [Chlamydoabsidia padenii]